MTRFADAFGRYLAAAERSEEGRAALARFERTFQFDLTDGEPFFLIVERGTLAAHPGVSPLDWKRRDWDKASCVRTSQRTLAAIMSGTLLPTEAFFRRELGVAPRGLADRATSARTIYLWLNTIFRTASEQVEREGRAAFLRDIGLAAGADA